MKFREELGFLFKNHYKFLIQMEEFVGDSDGVPRSVGPPDDVGDVKQNRPTKIKPKGITPANEV